MLTIALTIALVFLMITGGYFSGTALTSFLLFGVLPASLFLAVVLIVNILAAKKTR